MPIFKERSKLSPHYIPEKMLHREREQAFIKTVLGGSLDTVPQSFPTVVQVLGGVGAGKTTLAIKAGRWLEEVGRARRVAVRSIYVNLRGFSGGKVTAYRHLVRSVAEELFSQSLSAEELLANMLRHLKRTNTYLLIIFDELDYYVNQPHGHTLVYDFSRLPELSAGQPTNVWGVLFISREGGFRKVLDRPELSSLGLQILRLEPYRKKEAYDIISERAREALVEGAVSCEVLEFIAEKVSSPPADGDIRFGLDLLMYAGNLSESQGKKFIGLDDVRRVLASLYPFVSSDELAQLDDDEKVVLLALSRVLRVSERTYTAIASIART
ncbi:MAG: AAA family ATPase, partial [Nitrososphaerota archaeon]